MSGKERILKALRFEETDRPPHFESMFELTDEAFGLSFPERHQWQTCTGAEKERMIGDCMQIYEKIVDRYNWDALAVFWPWSDPDGVRAAKSTFGDDILIGSIVGNTVWSIENITDWVGFSVDLMEQPDILHRGAKEKSRAAIETFQRLAEAGAEFVLIVNDVAFNAGPFISPAQFHELVMPYLHEQVAAVQELGMIPFIHSDGNIMPLLDDLLSVEAACLHSLDPMAGVDIAEAKRRCGKQMALMGNVQCNLLQDGPLEAIRESVLYCLQHASPGGGHIFSTSNTIFKGLPLEHYEYMLQIYHEFINEKETAGC